MHCPLWFLPPTIQESAKVCLIKNVWDHFIFFFVSNQPTLFTFSENCINKKEQNISLKWFKPDPSLCAYLCSFFAARNKKNKPLDLNQNLQLVEINLWLEKSLGFSWSMGYLAGFDFVQGFINFSLLCSFGKFSSLVHFPSPSALSAHLVLICWWELLPYFKVLAPS